MFIKNDASGAQRFLTEKSVKYLLSIKQRLRLNLKILPKLLQLINMNGKI